MTSDMQFMEKRLTSNNILKFLSNFHPRSRKRESHSDAAALQREEPTSNSIPVHPRVTVLAEGARAVSPNYFKGALASHCHPD